MPSKNATNLAAYLLKGGIVPPCPNAGCTRVVSVRHWTDELPSFHNQCGPCKGASAHGKQLVGITFLKKRSCENSDGRLGWTCPVNPSAYAEFPTDCYHLDHINGNHEDNRTENLMTLCALCHTRKGKNSGDFNGSKSTSRKKTKQPPTA